MSGAAIKRRFLDWSKPLLPQTAALLIDEYSKPGVLPAIDLSGIVLVFPGERAAQRLTELLTELADKRGLGIVPPAILTAGELPEMLIPKNWQPPGQSPAAGLKAASRLERRLAWYKVISAPAASAEFSQLLPERWANADFTQWLRISSSFEQLSDNLGAEGVSVATIAGRLAKEGSSDSARWLALSKLTQCYLETLSASGFYDPDYRKLQAVSNKVCRSDRPIILAGCSDLNRSTCLCLEQAAFVNQTDITALIHAPDILAGGFDNFGGIISGFWLDYPLQIPDQMILSVQSPVNQAETAVVEIRRTDPSQATFGSAATIASCSEELLPFINEALADKEIEGFYIGGISARSTPPFRLLDSAGRFLKYRTFSDLSALCRHPDILAWLAPRHPAAALPAAIDRLYQRHLPALVNNLFLTNLAAHSAAGPDDSAGAAAAVLLDLLQLLEPLEAAADSEAIGAALRNMLRQIYSPLEAPGDARSILQQQKMLGAADAIICDFESSPNFESFPAEMAIELLLEISQNIRLQFSSPPRAVLLTGWLDLAHDDAPNCVICGFNDNSVPAPLSADPYLPRSLRQKLGMEDDLWRLARDSYLLAEITASKQRCRIIVGMESQDQTALLPSRLLLRSRGEALAGRLISLMESEVKTESAQNSDAGAAAELWRPRKPGRLDAPIYSMAATSFKIYLSCPYLFYLQRVLNLVDLDDQDLEMDPRQFGEALHLVLAAFGADPVLRQSVSPAEIEDFLNSELDRIFQKQYSQYSQPAVQVQFQHARMRLRAFAAEQAAWRRSGWVIEAVEQPFDFAIEPVFTASARIDVDRRPMQIRGRIDRIDRNERTGLLAIFDYKTSDKAQPPEKTHRTKNEWIDLQLPLYRFHAVSHYRTQDIALGYINLSADDSDSIFQVAKWEKSELDAAWRRAAEIAGLVRDEQFWPPNPAIALGRENEFSKLYGLERFSKIGQNAEMEAADPAGA